MNNKLLFTSIAALMVAPLLIQAEVVQAETIQTENKSPIFSMKGGLSVKHIDNKYLIQAGGYLQYDHNKSELNDVTDEDTSRIRRARLFIKGVLGENWSFKSQINTNGANKLDENYLRYSGFGKRATVTAGRHDMPFGLEQLTSSKDISVLERSAYSEQFSLGKKDGVQINGVLSENTAYAVAVFDDSDDFSAFAARWTWTPVKTATAVVHFGIAYQDLNNNSEAIGLEAAAVSGPFHIQAEYADQSTDDGDKNGYYVQVGYILTGESRPYKGSKFKRVKPAGKGGAWETVVRYEDGDGNYSDIELGRTDATAYTLGLNWYPVNNFRLGVNYADGESKISEDEGAEFRVRFQFLF